MRNVGFISIGTSGSLCDHAVSAVKNHKLGNSPQDNMIIHVNNVFIHRFIRVKKEGGAFVFHQNLFPALGDYRVSKIIF